jgi:hypothetical protein
MGYTILFILYCDLIVLCSFQYPAKSEKDCGFVDVKRELIEDTANPYYDEDPQPGCSYSDYRPVQQVCPILYVKT